MLLKDPPVLTAPVPPGLRARLADARTELAGTVAVVAGAVDVYREALGVLTAGLPVDATVDDWDRALCRFTAESGAHELGRLLDQIAGLVAAVDGPLGAS